MIRQVILLTVFFAIYTALLLCFNVGQPVVFVGGLLALVSCCFHVLPPELVLEVHHDMGCRKLKDGV